MNSPAKFTGIRLMVFDLDGTLIDAFADIADAANFILRHNNRPEMSIEEVKLHVGRGARYLVAGILATDDEDLIEKNHAKLVEYYKGATTTRATFYEGALETLDKLRAQGIKTAVISNKPDEITHKVLKVMGGYDHFDYIHGESERFPRKPAPDALIHVMEEAGVKREETLMVGDTTVDIEFARGAGVPVIAVTYGQMGESELQSMAPEATVHSMDGLLTLVSADR